VLLGVEEGVQRRCPRVQRRMSMVDRLVVEPAVVDTPIAKPRALIPRPLGEGVAT